MVTAAYQAGPLGRGVVGDTRETKRKALDDEKAAMGEPAASPQV